MSRVLLSGSASFLLIRPQEPGLKSTLSKMKKLFIIIAVALCALFVSSCSTVSNIQVTPSAVLDKANFHVVNTVSQDVSATYILGIGGGAKKAALEKAVAEMASKLGPNQALAYINVVESTKIPVLLPIYWTKTFKISAVVIQYDK